MGFSSCQDYHTTTQLFNIVNLKNFLVLSDGMVTVWHDTSMELIRILHWLAKWFALCIVHNMYFFTNVWLSNIRTHKQQAHLKNRKKSTNTRQTVKTPEKRIIPGITTWKWVCIDDNYLSVHSLMSPWHYKVKRGARKQQTKQARVVMHMFVDSNITRHSTTATKVLKSTPWHRIVLTIRFNNICWQILVESFLEQGIR